MSGSVSRVVGFSKDLKSVELHCPAILEIKIGSTSSLTIPAEILDEVLAANQTGTTLILGFKSNASSKICTPIKCTLTIPSLDSVVATSGTVEIHHLNGKNFSCIISNNARVVVKKGKVESQSITLSEQGKYDAPELMTQVATLFLKNHAYAYIQPGQQSSTVRHSVDSICYFSREVLPPRTRIVRVMPYFHDAIETCS